MDRSDRTAVVAGLFVLLAIALLIAVIFMIGRQSRYFSDNYHLCTTFSNISGLVEGAPVQLAGVNVGGVSSIRFPEDRDKKHLEVTLRIDLAVQDRIREDSIASVQTAGLLGDKFVAITIGSQGKPVLDEGCIINSVDPSDYYAILEQGTKFIEGVQELTARVSSILLSFEKTGIMNNMSKAVEDIARTTESLRMIVGDIESGERGGTLHALLFGDEGKKIMASVDETIDGLRGLIRQVEEGDGTLHKLLYTDEEGEILGDLEEASKSLKAILQTIESGEGTIGALINDPAVYEDLKTILEGAEKSRAIRALIRHTRRKQADGKPKPEGE